MPEATLRYHAGDGGDIFAPRALCGATPADEPNGTLSLIVDGVEVTCIECRTALMEARRA